MKKLALLILIIAIMFNQSCNSQNSQNRIPVASTSNYQSQNSAVEDQITSRSPESKATQYRVHYIAEGMYYLALPIDWEITGKPHTGMYYMTGPNGIRVFSTPFESYYFNCSPLMIQTAQMNGWTISNPVQLEAIVEQNLKPRIESQGGKFLKQYPVQEMEMRERYLSGISKRANGFQDLGLNLLATEWENSDGNRSLILIKQSIMASKKGFSMWTFSMDELEAPGNEFEKAKEVFLHALTNKKYDEQQIIATGQNRRAGHDRQIAANEARASEMLRRSAIAHNNRMAANEAAFQATQRAHRDAVNTASDLSMQGYWNRSNSSYKSQDNLVNNIHEENTITNPFDGRSIQVQAGYKRTFVDPFGNTYQTNDVLMNPGLYPELQHFREIK